MGSDLRLSGRFTCSAILSVLASRIEQNTHENTCSRCTGEILAREKISEYENGLC